MKLTRETLNEISIAYRIIPSQPRNRLRTRFVSDSAIAEAIRNAYKIEKDGDCIYYPYHYRYN